VLVGPLGAAAHASCLEAADSGGTKFSTGTGISTYLYSILYINIFSITGRKSIDLNSKSQLRMISQILGQKSM
jgi:hypothetical protein